jgi:maltodextrin utilization protein YvdJ
MLRFFVRSFTLKGVWDNRFASNRLLPWVFLLLVLLVSFPLNYQIVKTGGWALFDFTSKMREEAPAWLPASLPEDLAISNNGLEWFQPETSAFEGLNHAGETLLFVFQPSGSYEGTERALVFYPERIVYYEAGGTERLTTNYQNISERVEFLDLKMLERSDAVDQFAAIVEQAFSPYAVMRSVVLNLGINLLLNALLVLAVAVIFLLLRVKFQKVTNFGENLRIVLSAMTLPAMIAFVVGVLGVMEVNAFSAVVFQFFSPLIAVVAIFRGAKRSTKA